MLKAHQKDVSGVKGSGAPCQAISLIMECGRSTTFINIQMRRNEAAREIVAAQAVSGMRKEKQQQHRRHWRVGVLQGRGQDFTVPCSARQECGGGIVLFVEVCLILNMNRVERIASF